MIISQNKRSNQIKFKLTIAILTLVVCDTENPNFPSNSSISFFISVDFPLPEGPQRTKGLKFLHVILVRTFFQSQNLRIGSGEKQTLKKEKGKALCVLWFNFEYKNSFYITTVHRNVKNLIFAHKFEKDYYTAKLD